MHELAVTENILAVAMRHAEQAGACRIVGIDMVLGQLSSLIDDSIQFYWDIISRGTLAEGATLHFIRTAAVLECLACHHTFPPATDTFACPQCHSLTVKVVSGDELRLESIEVE
jgi:hydrogenase nickel incorporation protein HypA/HybF